MVASRFERVPLEKGSLLRGVYPARDGGGWRGHTRERPLLTDVLNVEARNSPILKPENMSDRFIF
jgi:hypothetical protein